MNLISRIILKWKVRKYFKPATESYLSRLGNVYGTHRIMYPEQCPESVDYQLIGFFSDELLGYPETDEHYRKRIKELLS